MAIAAPALASPPVGTPQYHGFLGSEPTGEELVLGSERALTARADFDHPRAAESLVHWLLDVGEVDEYDDLSFAGFGEGFFPSPAPEGQQLLGAGLEELEVAVKKGARAAAELNEPLVERQD